MVTLSQAASVLRLRAPDVQDWGLLCADAGRIQDFAAYMMANWSELTRDAQNELAELLFASIDEFVDNLDSERTDAWANAVATLDGVVSACRASAHVVDYWVGYWRRPASQVPARSELADVLMRGRQ